MEKQITKALYWIAVGIALIVLVYSFYTIKNPPKAISQIKNNGEHEPSIELIAVTVPQCWACGADAVINITRSFLPNLTVKTLNATEPEADRLITQNNLQVFPAFLLNQSFEQSASFQQLKDNFVWNGHYYLLKPEESRSVYYLQQPSLDNDPRKAGTNNTAVTVVIFGDFECPFTKSIMPTLQKVYTYNPGRVQMAYHDLPLRTHAKTAALAAACAQEQGAFWEYADILFNNQGALDRDDLLAYAQKLNLNSEAFAQCFDAQKYKKEVEQDYTEAVALGIKGTPAVFINNILIRGVHPFEHYQYVIEQEFNATQRS